VKSVEGIMNMLEAFDLTGSCRDAGELAGVSHHTVARYVQAWVRCWPAHRLGPWRLVLASLRRMTQLGWTCWAVVP
jgi:hypothetical protein